MAINDRVLPGSQWAYCVLTDPTQAPALSDMAAAARLDGVWLKYADGATTDPWLPGYQALAPLLRVRGIRVIPYLIVYPDDGTNAAWAQVAQGALADLAAAGAVADLVLDPDRENQWASAGAGAAQALFAAIRGLVPQLRPLVSAWGNLGAAVGFPWSVFAGACRAILPEIYPAAYAMSAADTYNMAFLGTGGGLGLEQVQPQIPVLPTFDLSLAEACAGLAANGGFPTVGWWHLDAMTAEQAAILAAGPYAGQQASQAAKVQAASAQPAAESAAARWAAAQAKLASALAELKAAEEDVSAAQAAGGA